MTELDPGNHKHFTGVCPVCQRIPSPYLPDNVGPSCPICRNNRCERMTFGPAQWFCPSCCTVFNGTQDEWISNRERRERHDKWTSGRNREAS